MILNSRVDADLKYLFILFLLIGYLFAGTDAKTVSVSNSANSGSVKGVVLNDKGENVQGANVFVLENKSGRSTDLSGFFSIENLKPGVYTIRISHVSYETLQQKITILENKTTEVIFHLKSSLFQIGGIEVLGTTELLPNEASSKTVITSGEIEHYQASSVKDILDLVPGVQRSQNPGLGSEGMMAIRSNIQDNLSTFGTRILLDGIPLTGNADLQYEKPGSTLLSYKNVMGGIDLRSIPADNIETIEVLTGLPSVKYGDFTEGIINIRTKTGVQPHRLKVKDNPDTREANLGGSWLIPNDAISYNLNVAQSERDIRIEGDEYTRFTMQSTYMGKYRSLSLNHKLEAQLIYDEEEPKGDAHKVLNYDRGFTLGYSTWGVYRFKEEETGSLDFNLYVRMQRKNSMKSKLVESDLRVLPDGDTVSAYVGKVETKGVEWTTGGKLTWNKLFFTGSLIHNILAGTDIEYNANTGEGIQFDTLFSYYGPDAGKRPYSFSTIPGQTLLSFYAEDQITGNLFYDYKISVGARYEVYRPFSLNLKGLWGDGDLIKAYQGSFFNPRFSLIIFFSNDRQIRISAGRSSKSPAMGLIYPPEEVFRWRNPESSEIHYLRYDRSSPGLKGIRESQFEISYDQKFFDNLGTSFTFYYKERSNETRNNKIPVFYISSLNKVYYIDYFNTQINSGWNITKGAEFIIRTNKIKALNMNFQISGSYNHLKGSDGNYSIDMTPDVSKGQYPNFMIQDSLIGFIYPNSGNWNDKIQLNYYLKYTLPPLGLWISLRAEQVVSERVQNYNLEPEDFELLTESGKQRYIFDRKIKTKGPKWLFNLSISKSLFRGAEISFYVNNFLDDPAIRRFESLPGMFAEEVRNPALFYGIEFSSIIDEMWK